MKTFTPIRAYLPSECTWVFRWLWETAIPALVAENVREPIQLVLTDGDVKMYNPFNLVRPRLYPNAIHGLCMFHLVSQPLAKLSMMDPEKSIVQGMALTFKLWLFSWMSMDGVETEAEYEESKAGLKRWLKHFANREA